MSKSLMIMNTYKNSKQNQNCGIKVHYEFEGKITAICDIFNVTILVTIKKYFS